MKRTDVQGRPAVNTNSVSIAGTLLERGALRFTPARVPVLAFKLRHVSAQVELEVERNVSCEVAAMAIGPAAQRLGAIPMGVELLVEGFLASRSMRIPTPVLHVTHFELLESSEGTK